MKSNKLIFISIAIAIAGSAFGVSAYNTILNNPSGTPPVGWWKMDEGTGDSIRDYSVNGNNGTVSNGGYGATSTDGKIGKALSFDGVDDYVYKNNATFDADGNWTITAWIKINSGSNQIFSAGDSVDSMNPALRVDAYLTGIGVWRRDNSNNELGSGSAGSITAGVWTHVVYAYNGTTITRYINGTNVGATAWTTGTLSTEDIAIGVLRRGRINPVEGFFNGLIDDMRIYNYARTADQIAADYRAGAYRTIVGTSVPSTWWTSGLVGYWNFDGKNTTSTAGTRDVSNNNNWGTFSGGVKPVGGISGQALSFDGVDDYVDAGNPANLNFNQQNFTIEGWFYADDLSGSSFQQIIAKWQDTERQAVLYVREASATSPLKIKFETGDASSDSGILSSTSIQTGTWYHVVGVYQDGVTPTLTIYLNGVVDNTGAGTRVGTGTSSWNIGRRPDASQYWDGLLDEVRIYNRALSADEIAEHYRKTRRNIQI